MIFGKENISIYLRRISKLCLYKFKIRHDMSTYIVDKM